MTRFLPRLFAPTFAAVLAGPAPSAPASTSGGNGINRGEFRVAPLAEREVRRLPDGALYWRIETDPTLAQA